jgi:hypothetical protein
VTASLKQRQQAADALRAGSTKAHAALAAGIGKSTVKRWLKDDPAFRAMVVSSPDIRPGPPARIGEERAVPESQRDLRCRIWLAADGGVLGSYIPPAAFESAGSVLHVHRVESDALDGVLASISAGAYPADSPYLPVPLAGLNELLENLPLVSRLASPDGRESLSAWLEVWTSVWGLSALLLIDAFLGRFGGSRLREPHRVRLERVSCSRFVTRRWLSARGGRG